MPAVRTAPDHLSVIVFSGDFERVHYALTMAAAAVASNTRATLFFTMGAARALTIPTADGRPGWHSLAGAHADADYQAKGIAGFEELLAACLALGVTIMVCETGLRALGMDAASLRPDLPILPGGLVTFLADASRHGAMVFV